VKTTTTTTTTKNVQQSQDSTTKGGRKRSGNEAIIRSPSIQRFAVSCVGGMNDDPNSTAKLGIRTIR
jgi:hypothetical protein